MEIFEPCPAEADVKPKNISTFEPAVKYYTVIIHFDPLTE